MIDHKAAEAARERIRQRQAERLKAMREAEERYIEETDTVLDMVNHRRYEEDKDARFRHGALFICVALFVSMVILMVNVIF